MPTTDYSADIRKAVRHYWRTKDNAWKKNQSGAKVDQGRRGAATAGKNFDGFAIMFGRLAKQRGGKGLAIHLNKSQVVLPGHFRPSKQWDLVLTREQRLIAVMEFKALGGPSFGNNANDRCEEALGSGIDLSVAQREGRFGAGASPFVGYCILVEDEEASRRAPQRGNPSPHFESDPAFKTASYQQRMQILCERMVQERIYTAAAVLASPPNAAKSGQFSDLSANTSLNRLIAKFPAHVEVETNA